MAASIDLHRNLVRFDSADTYCEAWHYPGTSGACVVMAAGLGVTKEPGTDPLATRLNDAGYSVLAFDYRHLGGSGGQPRQLVRFADQLADWDAAIAFTRQLPEVDPQQVAIWGFSSSGGHIFRVAASHPELAGAIAHAPGADGFAGMRNALAQTGLLWMLRLTLAGAIDVIGGLLGRAPVLIPLTGPAGSLAALTTPDSQNSPRALNPHGAYTDWDQRVSARTAVRIGFYRPGRAAPRITVPLLVLAFTDEGVAPAPATVRAGHRAPRGRVVELPGGHYETFLGDRESSINAILTFLDDIQPTTGPHTPRHAHADGQSATSCE